MSLFELATWIAVALAGAIGHEVAHYIVWLATGREPTLHLWALTVTPNAGPEHATIGDKISAGAPYAVGSVALLWSLATASVLWGIFGVAMVQVPSRADVDTMRGRVRWASLVE